ncbi:MAG TPA: biotin/lipoyl-binding protein, partial [Armatimonadota bacterium]|nr:biotin/lipoyl-binding protein [Armatimonadota bacterium]
MEHTEQQEARALLARFIRRRWKVPAQVFVGSTALMFILGTAAFRGDKEPELVPTPAAVPTGGVVESMYARGVGSVFPGSVAAVAVREGEAVKKGQLLFRMDTSQMQAQIRERESVWAPVFSAASARIARTERELHR